MRKNYIAVLVILSIVSCGIFSYLGIVAYQTFYKPSPAPIAAKIQSPTSMPTATFTPTATHTLAPPTDTPQPTPTNTMVVLPTSTPSATPTMLPATPTATRRPTQPPAPTSPPIPAQNIRFWSDSTNLSYGGCTILHWSVEGVTAYWVDGQPGSGGTGSKQVCPKSNSVYTLKYQERGGATKNTQVNIYVYGQPATPTVSLVRASGEYWDLSAGIIILVENGYVSWTLYNTGQCDLKSSYTKIDDYYVVYTQGNIYTIEFFLDNPDEIIGTVTFYSPYTVCGRSRAFIARKDGRY